MVRRRRLQKGVSNDVYRSVFDYQIITSKEKKKYSKSYGYLFMDLLMFDGHHRRRVEASSKSLNNMKI